MSQLKQETTEKDYQTFQILVLTSIDNKTVFKVIKDKLENIQEQETMEK